MTDCPVNIEVMMKSISNEDGQRLTSLMLESVPASHHGDILKSCAVKGPVVTFFNKVFYLWSQEQKKEALVRVKDKSNKKGLYRIILIDCLKMDRTIQAYESHTRFIEKVFRKFRRCFTNMTMEQMKKHDESKVASLLELVGYTARYWYNFVKQY